MAQNRNCQYCKDMKWLLVTYALTEDEVLDWAYEGA